MTSDELQIQWFPHTAWSWEWGQINMKLPERRTVLLSQSGGWTHSSPWAASLAHSQQLISHISPTLLLVQINWNLVSQSYFCSTQQQRSTDWMNDGCLNCLRAKTLFLKWSKESVFTFVLVFFRTVSLFFMLLSSLLLHVENQSNWTRYGRVSKPLTGPVRTLELGLTKRSDGTAHVHKISCAVEEAGLSDVAGRVPHACLCLCVCEKRFWVSFYLSRSLFFL